MRPGQRGNYTPPFALALCLLVAACAGPVVKDQAALQLQHSRQSLPVPFIPQRQYQCGPAALAMLLQFAGTPVTSRELVPQVYLPERRGSLQIDIVATGRRYGHVTYLLQPSLNDLLREIDAGNPVLVLQNQGFNWFPVWHYAVAIGYDLLNDEIILHSGEQRARRIKLTTFEHTWRRSKHWGLVITRDNSLPATAQADVFLKSVAALENIELWDAAAQGYQAALQRWPDSFIANFGLANIRYHQGKLNQAVSFYQRAIEIDPRPVAYHNLAITYADMDKLDLAEKAILKALAAGENKVFDNTRQDIQSRIRTKQDAIAP